MTTAEILSALNRAGYLPYADDYNVATVNLDDHGGAVKVESDGTGFKVTLVVDPSLHPLFRARDWRELLTIINVACEARAL